MTDKQFNVLFIDAVASHDRDEYVSDWALSSMWEDAPESDIPADRIDQLGLLWDVAHASIHDIRSYTGLSQAGFAERFCIPRRTVENWESNINTCADYLRLLLAQAVGMYRRPDNK